MKIVRTLACLAALTLTATQLHAAVVFPVKAYAKPEEPVVVKFVNEKGDEGKKAVQELGAEAAKLDALFSAAPGAEIAGADGAPLFTLFTADGKPIKAGNVKVSPEGTVDLAAAYPTIKDGGTFYLVWKDAPPLVIETLFLPGKNKETLERLKPQIDQVPADQKAKVLVQYSPVVTHMEIAQIAIITTDKGVIKAKFSYEYAPHTIDNFTTLARQNFYDNTTFHRILSGFMIQGGDALANSAEGAGMGGPGYEIMHEFSEKKHERGVLSMARSSSPDSAGSQFFIMHAKSPNLDTQYSAFGDVFEGLDVVDAIAKTPADPKSGDVKGPRPKIVSIKILPATAEIYGLKK